MDLSRRMMGRVALVTGGARGIGRAVATRFAAEGAAVVIGDIDAELAVEAGCATAADGQMVGLGFDDVRSAEQAAGAVAEAERRSRRLDILVNNIRAAMPSRVGARWP